MTPKAQRSEVTGKLDDGTLKVRIAAPPERGKANAELCALLAREYRVPARNVEIVTGASSSTKLVRITLPPATRGEKLS